jgi:hypothetical protein
MAKILYKSNNIYFITENARHTMNRGSCKVLERELDFAPVSTLRRGVPKHKGSDGVFPPEEQDKAIQLNFDCS